MDKDYLKNLLKKVQNKDCSIEHALEKLKDLPYKDLGFVKVDHHRSLRKGFPEVVFCEGKKTQESLKIIREILRYGKNLLATRASRELFEQVKAFFPKAFYHERARMITVEQEALPRKGKILVLSAGTSDIPVAEEAAVTAEILGNQVERIYDVGVAGIHRLLHYMKDFQKARVLVVVAGMEGALPSVVAGLVDRLVIAVPTSIGYGAHFHGVAPLLTMLNSCSSGVAVMNIDNGFGAGFAASLVNQLK